MADEMRQGLSGWPFVAALLLTTAGCYAAHSDHPAADDGLPADEDGGAEVVPEDGGDVAAPAGPAEFLEQAAVQACADTERCCPSGWSSHERGRCATELVLPDRAALVESVAAGRIRYDASQTDACLAAVSTYLAPCLPGRATDVFTLLCRAVFVGQVAAGGVCATGFDCAVDATCAPVGDGLRCVAASGENGRCDDSSLCAAGLVCAQDACRAPVAIGQACEPEHDACSVGTYCDASGTCVPQQVDGSCETDRQCVEGCERWDDGEQGECNWPQDYVTFDACEVDGFLDGE